MFGRLPPTPENTQADLAPNLVHTDVRTIYHKKGDLAQHQIAECETIFGIGVNTLKCAQTSRAQIEEFCQGIFDRWTSTKELTKPRCKNRQFASSCVDVGVFNADLPLAKIKTKKLLRYIALALILTIYPSRVD
jgi:hypothetical protein